MYKYLANTLFTAKKVIYLPSCHSTNDISRQYVQNKELPEGALVITDEQTAGKGQRGNNWISEKNKNLTFSIVYKPTFLKVEEGFSLNMITSLAIKKAFHQLGLEVSIKWPNDIYYGNKKLGGILVENTVDQHRVMYSIIGIGLNINQEEFSVPTAISVKNILRQEFDLQKILEQVIENLESLYLKIKSRGPASVKEEYDQKLWGVNAIKDFQIAGQKVEGIIRGTDNSGRLKVEIAGEMRYFSFKEITFMID